MFIITLFTIFLSSVSYAQDGPPPDFIKDHASTVQWAFGLVLFGLLALVAWYVRNSDENNKEQWRHINAHTTDITELKIEAARGDERCKYNHSGGRREYDPKFRSDSEGEG